MGISIILVGKIIQARSCIQTHIADKSEYPLLLKIGHSCWRDICSPFSLKEFSHILAWHTPQTVSYDKRFLFFFNPVARSIKCLSCRLPERDQSRKSAGDRISLTNVMEYLKWSFAFYIYPAIFLIHFNILLRRIYVSQPNLNRKDPCSAGINIASF